MKKKLEAELISIAHRILKLKNKSELEQLHLEVQKLYEKLSVLRFVEEHFEAAKPTIGRSEVDETMAAVFETEIQSDEPEVKPKKSGLGKSKGATDEIEATAGQNVEETQIEETTASAEMVTASAEVETPEIVPEQESVNEEQAIETAELAFDEEKTVFEPNSVTNEPVVATNDPIAETQEDIHSAEVKAIQAIAQNNDTFFKPSFELAFDSKEEEEPKTADQAIIEDQSSAPIVFEEFLGKNYVDPVFVKPEELNKEDHAEEAIPIGRNFSDSAQVIPLKQENESQTQTLNDRISKGLTIGLNDRIAFMKHLFNNSSEDYNRVLSQLITFDTLSEATNFIDNMVKPDYNNWEGKDEYSQRFIEIIEKKFA